LFPTEVDDDVDEDADVEEVFGENGSQELSWLWIPLVREDK
jgi:hypothetical protein